VWCFDEKIDQYLLLHKELLMDIISLAKGHDVKAGEHCNFFNVTKNY